MKKNLFKRTKPWLTACLLGLGGMGSGIHSANAQANAYQFSQSTGTYTPIVGGTIVDSAYYASTANTMDTKGWSIPLPFTFVFNGTGYTSIYANSNGGATFGTTTSTGAALISATTGYDGAIAGMNRDLWGIFASQGTVTSGSNIITNVTDFTGLAIGTTMGNTTGIPVGTTVTAFDPLAGTITMSVNATGNSTDGSIRWGTGKVITTTLGSAPNRKFVIEWKNFGDYATGANVRSLINFQIILNETTNKVEVVFGPCSQLATTSRTYQVGLRGTTNADFNNRTSATAWNATTAGSANNSTVTRTDAINPVSGLTFTWTPATCLPPTGVTIGSVTTGGATVSWTASSSAPANGYDYYYSTTNTAPTASTTPSGSTTAGVTTATIGSLSSATTYYVWVRSKCSASDVSNWTMANSFTTLCNVFTAPFSQSFSGGSLPNCWTNTNNTNSSSAALLWMFTGSMDYGTTGNGGKTAGTFAWVDASSPYNSGDSVIIVTPSINLTGLTTPFLQFEWFKNHLTSSTGTTPTNYSNNVFSVDINSGSGWTTLFSDTTNDAAWRTVGLTLPATYNNTTVRFRFIVNKHTWNGYFYDNVALDEVHVMEAPLCFVPTATNVTGITQNSASISWTAPASAPANGYEYYHSTSNVSPTTATAATGTATATNTTIGSLAANTKYYYWVRSVCTASNKSMWTAIDSFYTGHCQPNGLTTSISYYISSAATTGAITDLNYSATSGVSYVNNTATNLVSYPGNTFTYNIAASAGTNYFYIWVDWNNDLDFTDAGETVLATTSYAASTSGTLTIPTTTPLGNYRMRVANSWSGVITACGPAAYGNYIDYTLVIGAAPSCLPPSALSTTNLMSQSATIGWTASTTTPANGYEYYYSTANTAPTAGTVASGSVAAGITTANIGSLTPNTVYYVWVRSVCSSSDKSGWGTAASFTTLCAPYGLPFSEDFSGTTFPPNCWERYSGELGNPSVLTPGGTLWVQDDWLNVTTPANKAAKINLYSNNRRGWLVTPQINLGPDPGNILSFDVGIVTWNTSTPQPLPGDDSVVVLISKDGGTTWSNTNSLLTLTNSNGILGANGSNNYQITLTDTGLVRFAFFGTDGTIDNTEDNDIMIDNVSITAPPCTPPVVALGNDTTICAGATLTLDAGTGTGLTYLWNTAATTSTIDVTATGTYHVTVSNGTCEASDTIVVSVIPNPVVDLGNDTTDCVNGGPITLTAGTSTSNTYLWSDNSTSPTLSATTSGTYWVAVTNAAGCVSTDTIELVMGQMPSIGGIQVTGTSPTFNFEAQTAQNAEQYSWDFGDGASSTDAGQTDHTYTPGSADQTYTVSLIVSNECGSDTVTTSVIVRGTSIKDLELNADALKMYPNPTANKVNIENASPFRMKQVIITNVLGQQVAAMPIDGNIQTIDVSKLTSGLYHVKIEFEEGTIVRKLEILK